MSVPPLVCVTQSAGLPPRVAGQVSVVTADTVPSGNCATACTEKPQHNSTSTTPSVTWLALTESLLEEFKDLCLRSKSRGGTVSKLSEAGLHYTTRNLDFDNE